MAFRHVKVAKVGHFKSALKLLLVRCFDRSSVSSLKLNLLFSTKLSSFHYHLTDFVRYMKIKFLEFRFCKNVHQYF